VNYLDPLIKVGRQVQGFAARRAQLRAEPDRYSQEEKDSGSFAARRAQLQAELFARYNLGTEVANLYPFELSGGMSRRVLLCCALIDNPRVIIADEPTPGLDLDLAKVALADFRKFANDGGGVLLITHDIELALSVADRVAVFNNGTIVEETAVANFASPLTLKHPFSKALWHALPEHDFSLNPSGED
jgi:ABC-type dipeptide/oligopeptide/nickel transport system ATPase component